MIFLSHNSNDKPVVEQVALKLKEVFGQDKVFYDSWSIQPGDGIIDKMEEGLSECRFFFFFVSANSLTSAMVRLEWQNALVRAAKNHISFIPIRMDTVSMPFLLTQTLYIDLYSQGLEIATRQIIDVINGTNTYKGASNQFHNVVAYKYIEDDYTCIDCYAEHYFEPVASFMFLTNEDPETIQTTVTGQLMHGSGQGKDITLNNGEKYNFISISLEKGLTPKFPLTTKFKSEGKNNFILGVMHEKSRGEFQMIPIINGKKP